MSKSKEKSFLWILFIAITAVQCVFALYWLLLNFNEYYPDFFSDNYIKAAQTLKVDDFMGIGYALIVKILGHEEILKIFQMLSVYASGAWLTHSFLNKKIYSKECLITGAFILSNPFVIQSTCMVLPNTLILAGLMLMAGLYKEKRVLWFLFTDILVGLLNPDYIYIAILGFLPFIIFGLFKKKESSVKFLVSAFTAFLFCFLITNLVTDSKAYGGYEKNLLTLLVQRTAIGNLASYNDMYVMYHDMDFYTELTAAEKTTEELWYTVFPKTAEILGESECIEICKYVFERSLEKGIGRILKLTFKDFLYYFTVPFSIAFIYLTKGMDSSIVNLLMGFIQKNPGLFKVYLLFEIFIIAVLIITGIIKALKEKRLKTNVITLMAFVWITCVISLFGSFVFVRGFNYLNALPVITGWPLILIYINYAREER